MARYRAYLLRVEEESNPEECVVNFEADTDDQAHMHVVGLFKQEQMRGMGWRSYADSELWGQEQRTIQRLVRLGADTRTGQGGQDYETEVDLS
jgi:hypothetical protein